MNKTTIVFRISGSEIALESAPGAVTAGSISEPQCRFRFSEQWDDYGAKLAFFGTDRDRLVPMALAPVAEEARSYYCYIPRAVLAGLQRGGELFICCSGSGSDSEAVLRTKLYTLRVADSGEATIYLTESEAETLLGSVAAAMELQRNENALALELQRTENSATVASIRAENSAAIARLESGSIASAAINASHELVLTMKDGTAVNLGNVRGEPGDGITNAEVIDGVLWLTTLYGSRYSAGYVKGEKGEKGDKGDTGAQGSPGAAGADGEDGTDGISITGVVASIDSNNKRVFTFTFSDGSTRAVIVPGEVITITDEDGEHPQSIAVQAAVQGLGNAVVALDERSTTNSRRITALDESKADVYEANVQMDERGDIYLSQAVIDDIYRVKPAVLKVKITNNETVAITQIFSLVSAATVPGIEYEGLLTYQAYDFDYSEHDNAYARIKIPRSASSKVLSENFIIQEKIDEGHKLSADVVDDTNTAHKFVSAAEKASWSNKADKTTITGTDGKQYTIRFTLVAGKPVLEYEEVTQ